MPTEDVRRPSTVAQIAREAVENRELVSDVYESLELLTGEDLSGQSVADLVRIAEAAFSNGRLGDLWAVAFELNLIDEEMLQYWVLFEGLTHGNA